MHLGEASQGGQWGWGLPLTSVLGLWPLGVGLFFVFKEVGLFFVFKEVGFLSQSMF